MLQWLSENFKLLAAIYAFAAPFAGYIIAHKVRDASEKKLLAEAKNLDINSVSDVINIYKTEVVHIKKMYESKVEELKESFEYRVKQLQQEINILEATNKELMQINKEHKKENEKLKKHNQQLKKMNEAHEKTIGKLNAIITHQNRKLTTYEKKYGDVSN